MVRDKKGRFVKGVSGNPKGRAPKSREERFYDILVSTLTDDDWEDIIKRAVSDAKRGDTSARTWLSNYYVGPPVERKEITGADGQALRIEVVDVSD